MKFNDLTVSKSRSAKRVGRGIAAGQGKTAGRGTKGQKARTGSSRKPGFEGGQNPLMQRLPKLHGFKSHRVKPENIYTGQLSDVKGKTVDNFTLAEAGLVTNPHVNVKLLVKGEISKAVTVKLQAASENAIAAVQKAGGTFEAVPQVGRIKTAKKVKK